MELHSTSTGESRLLKPWLCLPLSWWGCTFCPDTANIGLTTTDLSMFHINGRARDSSCCDHFWPGRIAAAHVATHTNVGAGWLTLPVPLRPLARSTHLGGRSGPWPPHWSDTAPPSSRT